MELRDQLERTLSGNYTFERELGGGGMSRVFVATEQALGRQVVVKVLPAESSGQVSIDRFKREIRLAAGLQQANIVPVLSAGDAGGVPYYTMPFVKGETLRSRIATKGALPIAECIAILRDVARALAFAHAEGVVHRDIKPDNILISGGTAVVTDFGIAKAFAASHTHPGPTLTQLGVTLGTPAYMAPEQAVGEEVDHRADIYSLGVVAYELLSGTTPFAGRSSQAMLAAHAMEAPNPVSARRVDIPTRLAGLVMRCLSKEQAERPQTAIEVLEDLEAAAAPQTGARDPAVRAGTPSIGRDGRPAVAVLPLRNMSANADDEYFSDGITEDIIAQLSQIAALKVIARTSVMRYKKTAKSAKEIAAELSVSHVVEGSVRRAGQRLRIVAQLIDAASEATLWTETFDRELADVFAIQTEVADRVTGALRSKLTSSDGARPVRRAATDSLEAYDAYLRARFEWNKGTTEGYRKCIEHCERALAIDPSYALAHVSLASALQMLMVFVGDTGSTVETARTHVARALEFDPLLPEANATSAYIHFWFDWNWREAERLFERAIELGPNSSMAHNYWSVFLSNMGRPDDAVVISRRTIELDPLWSTAHHDLGFDLFQAGRFEESVAALERALELAPDYAPSLCVKGFALMELRNFPGALSVFRRCEATSPGVSLAQAGIVLALARSGNTRAARRAVQSLHDRSSAIVIQPSAFAWAHAALGDTDIAFEYVERMIAEREAFTVCLSTFAWWDPLRADARFAEILRRLRFPARLQAMSDARRLAYAERTQAARRVDTRPAIAVLPLRNMSASADDEYFSDGITEDIIAQLSQIAGLKVISRTSTMRYKHADKNLRDIAGELGVGSILEGSVRRAGNRVRIVAQLIDAEADEHLWTDTYDRELTDVFAIQSDVAIQVASALRAVLAPEEQARVERKPTDSVEAYNHYLLGRYALNKRSSEQLQRAIQCFERAIEQDPKYAAPYAGLADAYTLAAIGYGVAPRDALPRAKAAAVRALELDDSFADAHTSLGYVRLNYDWDYFAAEREFRRALELNPSSAQAHQWGGHARLYICQWDEGRAMLERALELDPLSVLLTAELAWPHAFPGNFDEGMRCSRRALAMDPDFALAHYNLAQDYDALGRLDASIEEADLAARLSGRASFTLALLGRVRARRGDRVEARAIAAELQERAGRGEVVNHHVAVVLDALEESDVALEWLERAYEAREPMLAWLHVVPFGAFENLRKDARFDALLDRIGMAKQMRAAGS